MKFDYHQHVGEVRPCIVCGNDPRGVTRSVWATDGSFTALECGMCGMVSIEPPLTQEGLNLYYDNYIGDRIVQKAKMELRDKQYYLDLAYIEQYVSGGEVLDVGCNGGFFLDKFDQRFSTTGIEVDQQAVRHAREQLGLRVYNEVFGEDNLPNEHFDLVIFRGVIEHLIDPRKAVNRAFQVLKPGGKLFFCATPNLECFSAYFYREKWNVWHPIEHINIFNKSTLHQLIGFDRFSLINVDYPYLGTPYENEIDDYAQLCSDILAKEKGEWSSVRKSPPFWGNMLSAVFEKLKESS